MNRKNEAFINPHHFRLLYKLLQESLQLSYICRCSTLLLDEIYPAVPIITRCS